NQTGPPDSSAHGGRDQLTCRARRPAAAGGRETLKGVPTRVDVRSKTFSDAGSTPAASTISCLNPRCCADCNEHCNESLIGVSDCVVGSCRKREMLPAVLSPAVLPWRLLIPTWQDTRVAAPLRT